MQFLTLLLLSTYAVISVVSSPTPLVNLTSILEKRQFNLTELLLAKRQETDLPLNITELLDTIAKRQIDLPLNLTSGLEKRQLNLSSLLARRQAKIPSVNITSYLLATRDSSPTYSNSLTLIRHGEKPSSGNGLNADGEKRSQCLRQIFGAGSGYNIGKIIAEGYNPDGTRERAYETVAPLAQDLGLTVDVSW